MKLTNPKTFTHDDLVALAARWLRKDHALVITEMAGGMEEADAIGWLAIGDTTLVECKVSRADFLSDKKKIFRENPEIGMGDFRYYMCPAGLIKEEEIPKGWGLLWVKGKRIYKKALAARQTKKGRDETGLLISLMRRIGRITPDGVSVKFYTYNTGNTATAGVCMDADERDLVDS